MNYQGVLTFTNEGLGLKRTNKIRLTKNLNIISMLSILVRWGTPGNSSNQGQILEHPGGINSVLIQ